MPNVDDFDAIVYAIDRYLFTKSVIEEWRIKRAISDSPDAKAALEKQRALVKECVDNYFKRLIKRVLAEEGVEGIHITGDTRGEDKSKNNTKKSS